MNSGYLRQHAKFSAVQRSEEIKIVFLNFLILPDQEIFVHGENDKFRKQSWIKRFNRLLVQVIELLRRKVYELTYLQLCSKKCFKKQIALRNAAALTAIDRHSLFLSTAQSFSNVQGAQSQCAALLFARGIEPPTQFSIFFIT